MGRSPRWTKTANSSARSTCHRRKKRTAEPRPARHCSRGSSHARTHARIAFEFVGARPTDTKVAAFAFGRARGVIEGCAGTLGLPIVFLTPAAWKRLAAIPPGAENKDLARTPHATNSPTVSNSHKLGGSRSVAAEIVEAVIEFEVRRASL
jgi:hypothetical protein